MSKILFPTDFSKASLNAFAYALHFAARIEAEIVTQHAYDIPAAIALENYDFLMENYNIMEMSEFENYSSEAPRLRKMAEKLKLGHIRLSHVLSQGEAVTEILKSVKGEKPDFIVMGTQGATGLKEVFLGTVTERVISQSDVPVFAIPENARFVGIKKILFLAELEKLELGTLMQVKKLSDILGARIEVLQVKPEKEEVEDLLLNAWSDRFKGSPVHFNIIHSNAAEDIIIDFVEIDRIAITAMAVHHKNLWQRLFQYSLARKLAYHTRVPLLALPVR